MITLSRLTVSFIAISTAILFNLTVASADYNYRIGWNNIGKNGRVNWVWGFQDGQSLIKEEVNTGREKKIDFEYDVSGFGADVISEVMVKLYEDPANSYIPWKYMAWIAVLRLRGVEQAGIDSKLTELRQYVDYIRNESKRTK